MINELVIGIAGGKGMGKDTFADHFITYLTSTGITDWHIDGEVYGKTAIKRMRFAQPLIDQLQALGISYPDTLEKKESLVPGGLTTYRQVITSFSDWATQNFGEDCFFKMSKLAAAVHRVVVFTDVRLSFEWEYIRQNGLLIHVVGDKLETATSGHRTEQGVPIDTDRDLVIYNHYRTQPKLYTPDALNQSAYHAARFVAQAYHAKS